MLKSGIYCISSLKYPERKYIGSAHNLKKRYRVHIYTLQCKEHFNQKLQNHCTKHGISDLKFDIILLCPISQLIYWEQLFINAIQPWFNICPTAGSRRGTRHRLKSRLAASAKMKAKPRPQPGTVLKKFT